MTEAFSGEKILADIGAIKRESRLEVLSLTGRLSDWTAAETADVVVSLPQALSPADEDSDSPSRELFDLLIVDEAHHAPAPTWRAILDLYSDAKVLLLTATPRRRDGQKLPGTLVYHYPLRQALEEGIFKRIRPDLIKISTPPSREEIDLSIARRVAEIKALPEHATSTIMVRAESKARASHLARLYADLGVEIAVLHSGLGSRSISGITDDLRACRVPGVAVVGMLIEGFDLPSLRILAYHDKHKSLPITAQTLGRLARVDQGYPQESVLVTARDIDVFPQLEGTVRELYAEDADWATVLPGIIDDEISAERAARDYAQQFVSTGPGGGEVAPEDLAPVRRTTIFEVPASSDLARRGFFARVPERLSAGKILRGETIIYSGMNPHATTLVLVTRSVTRPPWQMSANLDSLEYSLHLLSWRQAPRTDLPHLILLNSDKEVLLKEVVELLDTDEERQIARARQLQDAFDSLERLSVSSVGLRNSYGGQMGQASYKMMAGKGVDRGMREADTSFGALGHAMIQVQGTGGAFTAGVATGKGKYWETRYSPLVAYDEFLTDFSERYWFPPAAAGGPLLPQVTRGSRLEEWPAGTPLAAEVDGALMGTGWSTEGKWELDALELEADHAVDVGSGQLSRLPLRLIEPRSGSLVWSGSQDCLGIVTTTSDSPSRISRGFAPPVDIGELFTHRPPTIFFADGRTVIGPTIIESRLVSYDLPAVPFTPIDWDNTDLEAETRRTALSRGLGNSVHEHLESVLRGRARRGTHRWIVHNDGPGEFADYLIVEIRPRKVWLELWHAKAAGGPVASIRVSDLQEVIAQAIKSRRWITDTGFWEELEKRISGARGPKATVLEGRETALRLLCGYRSRSVSFGLLRPVVAGRVVIVQPGLSVGALDAALLSESSLPGKQSRDLLAVFHDSVSQICDVEVMCSY